MAAPKLTRVSIVDEILFRRRSGENGVYLPGYNAHIRVASVIFEGGVQSAEHNLSLPQAITADSPEMAEVLGAVVTSTIEQRDGLAADVVRLTAELDAANGALQAQRDARAEDAKSAATVISELREALAVANSKPIEPAAE